MRAVSMIALVAAIGAGGAMWLDGAREATGTEAAAPAQPGARALRGDRLTQNYSSKCSTGATICIVPAQPVGSPCSCSGTPGTIIP